MKCGRPGSGEKRPAVVRAWAACPARLFALEFGEGKCQLGWVQPLHTTGDMSPSPCSTTTSCLCFGGVPASSRAPTIHCDILLCHLAWRRPGQWDTSSHRKESPSGPELTWLGGHEACCACCTLTTQGLGGVPSIFLLKAHTGSTWEWTQLLLAPLSGAFPQPHAPHAATSHTATSPH